MEEVLLPDGWTHTIIGDICFKVTDGSHNPPKASDNGLPMLSAKNIHDGGIDFEKNHRLISVEDFEQENRRTKIQSGDVLLTIVGALGRTAVVDSDTPKFTLQRSVAVLSAPYLDSKFFRYSLESYNFQKQILENAKGTAQQGIYLKKLKDLEIQFPPFAEQKVIANKLDTLLAQVETAKARLESIAVNLKRFRQSVLAGAVSGKLTDGWRALTGTSIDGWSKTNVGDIAEVATGKTPKRTTSEYWYKGTIPWLTSASTGAHFIYESEQFITDVAVKECTLKLLKPGTLLLAMYGEGKTRGQVTELKILATCNQACAAITVDESFISREFMKLKLVENYEETRKAASGGAQPNLNLNKVREIPVYLPSKEEQTEIVHRVDQLFGYIESIEQQVQHALARVNNLAQSILAKAFRGELTADWRAANPDLISGDNSVEALLKKIKTEREALATQPKKRKLAGKKMSKQIIQVIDALKAEGKALSGQELLAAAGYPSDSNTEQLGQFFLDLRDALGAKQIIHQSRDAQGQDWFALAE